MKIAIYSRKSKFVTTSNNNENQIAMCKDYIEKKYGKDNDITIYEDEGFTGKNVVNPKLKKLMSDINNNKIDILICYKLNIIFRSMSHFSSTYKIFEKNNVTFISVNEDFNSSTPLCKSIIYISSIFNNIQKNITSDRIINTRDELAKKGSWLGGLSVLGYNNVKEIYLDNKGKSKTLSYLSIDRKEIETVNIIYLKYLELHSIRLVYEYCLATPSLRGKNNSILTRKQINTILRQILYVKADDEVFTYLKSKGYSVFGKPNSKNGLLAYSKSKSKIVAVAKHEGGIPSELWLNVQLLLDENKAKFSGPPIDNTGLLRNILKCSCGSSMNIIPSGDTFNYVCNLKSTTNGEKCECPDLDGSTIEKIFIDFFKNFDINLLKNDSDYKKDTVDLIMKKIALVDNSVINDILVAINKEKYSSYDFNIVLNDIMRNLKNESMSERSLLSYIDIFSTIIDKKDFSLEQKRISLKKFVPKISWDYKNNTFEINLFYN